MKVSADPLSETADAGKVNEQPTLVPSRNGDHHIQNKDEEREYRSLNTEWQDLWRNSGLEVDIDRHEHLKEEA